MPTCSSNETNLQASVLKEIRDTLMTIQDYLLVILILIAVMLGVPVMYALSRNIQKNREKTCNHISDNEMADNTVVDYEL